LTKRTRILFLVPGIVTLAAAVRIAANLRGREIRDTDETVEIGLIAPAGS